MDTYPTPRNTLIYAAVKAVVLIFFIIGALFLIRCSPVKDYLTAKGLGEFLKTVGIWAPAAFIVFYTVGVCLFIPATLLTTLGATLFGAYWGFVFVWLGAMAGASAAFWIGRTLGRDFADHLIGNKLKKYDEAIERNGFATVFYLRLVYLPFSVLNFGLALTRVRFRDYFFGTGLGILAGTFIFTLVVGTLIDIWISGRWERLLSFKVLLAMVLFIFSFFIPIIIKRLRKEGLPII